MCIRDRSEYGVEGEEVAPKYTLAPGERRASSGPAKKPRAVLIHYGLSSRNILMVNNALVIKNTWSVSPSPGREIAEVPWVIESQVSSTAKIGLSSSEHSDRLKFEHQ